MSGIGIDLVRVADVSASLARFGDRYRRRVFAPVELESASRFADPGAHLAGRFAAKEAVFKALGLDATTPVPWPDIVIEPRPGMGPVVRLAGRLGRFEQPITVSISHEGEYAIACAWAPHALSSAADATASATQVSHIKGRESLMHESTIISVLDAHAKLPMPAAELAADADLYEAGMTSHASVAVMLGLEDALDVEFPDELLTRETFASIAAIDAALVTLS